MKNYKGGGNCPPSPPLKTATENKSHIKTKNVKYLSVLY